MLFRSECCIKHPKAGAAEGAPFIRERIIRVTDRAFDDFAGAGAAQEKNKWILGLAKRPEPETKPEPRPEPEPVFESVTQPEAQTDPTPEPVAETRWEPEPTPEPDLKTEGISKWKFPWSDKSQ